jgi:two-component system phosphate regulon sensor histidine kinase PhoR
MIEALADPAMVIDGFGNVLHTNAPLLTLFPRARLGLPYSLVNRSPELIEAVDGVMLGRPLSVAIEERVPVRRKLLAMVGRLETPPTATPPEPGRPAVLITFRDISEQERLAEMRADFIANASHELRTPLASLRGFVETLQGPARNDPAARDRFLGLMASQAARMTRLIDDLLSLSRVEMRMHVPPSGVVDLEEVAAFVVQSLEPMRAEADIEVRLNRAAGQLRVRGDRDELVQIVQNLVQNALKYGRKGGLVEVTVKREAGGTGGPDVAVFSVRDDGPGIPAEHLPRLTERFYRVNASISRDKGGTGLGLAIVKNIVNRHRGDLSIASEAGNGSTFTVRLPVLARER